MKLPQATCWSEAERGLEPSAGDGGRALPQLGAPGALLVVCRAAWHPLPGSPVVRSCLPAPSRLPAMPCAPQCSLTPACHPSSLIFIVSKMQMESEAQRIYIIFPGAHGWRPTLGFPESQP